LLAVVEQVTIQVAVVEQVVIVVQFQANRLAGVQVQNQH
jgi:hypothetical protein